MAADSSAAAKSSSLRPWHCFLGNVKLSRLN
uniref:Uncharacterized protein n=1 Tax=Anguilla anguilla TaxID=7936 RepID=A0A0E9UHW5_ANGAN